MLSYNLDILLFSERRFWKLEKILELTGLKSQEFHRQLSELNRALQDQKQRPLEFRDDVLALPERLENFEAVRFNIDEYALTLSESKRQCLIYLLVFSKLSALSTSNFQSLLNVSRNTVLSDIKKLRQQLNKGTVSLEYSRKSGFYLKGEELELRQIAWRFLQELHDDKDYYVLSKYLNQENKFFIYEVGQETNRLIRELKVEVVHSRYVSMLIFLALLQARLGSLKQNIQEVEALVIGMSDGNFDKSGFDFLYRIGFEIMENVMKLAAVEFEDFTKTFAALRAHLVPAYFRLKYHYEIDNVLLPKIKAEYASLFELMALALAPLHEVCGKISEDERAYFVILFGGEIYKKKHAQNLRAIVLCVNGVSSSLIMRKRLENMFPNMTFLLSTASSDLDNIPAHSYDIIFSTVPVMTDKKLYVMSAFPDIEEETRLYNQISQDFNLPGFYKPSAQAILRAIEPYVDIKSNATKKQLTRIIDRKLNNKKTESEALGVMLSDLLTQEKIHFTDEELDWKSAITLAAQPLLRQGEIEESYISAIINRVDEFGPYIDLGMGIALPHARPEDGVNKLGMSLLKCDKPVYLQDDPKHEIKIFIVLAAIDNETHLKALSTLTQILSNKEELNKMLTAETVAELEQIFSEKEGE
ncbi:BglG family transcription antiterminator [Lactococcus muris]|uniref:BglG family transcription antiterminator n=1 Tax=Lactococcus muris TaxID=2941330 RepID=UPI00230011B2